MAELKEMSTAQLAAIVREQNDLIAQLIARKTCADEKNAQVRTYNFSKI